MELKPYCQQEGLEMLTKHSGSRDTDESGSGAKWTKLGSRAERTWYTNAIANSVRCHVVNSRVKVARWIRWRQSEVIG